MGQLEGEEEKRELSGEEFNDGMQMGNRNETRMVACAKRNEERW